MRILVLGGTTEATRLAKALADRPDLDAVLSYAGRTELPAAQPIPVRIGGFGGPEGLATHLASERFDLLVDATHPFASRISANAALAARLAGIPLIALVRPAWSPVAGDRWTEVEDLAAAATALGTTPKRVLLTVGRLGLPAFEASPFHDYLIRTIDPPVGLALPKAEVILHRPPFDADSEAALMVRHRTEVLVTKNSGGSATYGKIEAARRLGLPVILVRRPPRPDGPTVAEPADVMAWIDGHGRLPADRGE